MGLKGYKIWQPHSVSPSYSVSPQLGDVMGWGGGGGGSGGKYNSKHSWRELNCHCLPLFGMIGLSQTSQLSLTNSRVIRVGSMYSRTKSISLVLELSGKPQLNSPFNLLFIWKLFI